jgi:hypothetical protein
MSYLNGLPENTALQTIPDMLLADTAIRIQLTPTHHDLAVARYEAINDWLDRPESPLCGRVALMYSQGSMAIGATIASKLRTDEFDIDIIAELAIRADADPEAVLDLLYRSIRGERGSRYYSMTTRRNRCVTVTYADGMHLDITPAVLLGHLRPKTSVIFHHKPETPEVRGYRLWANPFGFAEWFKETTPLDHAFAKAFADRAMDSGLMVVMDRAASIPVPDRQDAHQKSKAVIALQLLKRARNVSYDMRQNLRRPPSVMMAKLVADGANQTATLTDEVLHQAQHLHAVINAAHRQRQAVEVRNPSCNDDNFTDRWPGSLREQELYLNDLQRFIGKMAFLAEGNCDLPEMRDVMAELFGENPTGAVFKSFTERLGQISGGGRSVYQPRTSHLDLAKSGLAAPVTVPSRQVGTTPRHNFFGRSRE